MPVNFFQKLAKNTAIKLVVATVIAFCTIFFLAAFVIGRSEDDVISRRVNIAVRAIGHELLLQAGDSTSLVRPVIEKSSDVFLLEFENEFVFQPDTLVAIVQRFLSKTELSHYTVTVQECHRPAIVYGFEINLLGNSVTPCRGRSQPKACYDIEIAFADFPKTSMLNSRVAVMISGILSVLAFVLIGGNLGIKKSKPSVAPQPLIHHDNKTFLTIGRLTFDINNQCLRMGEETILLTDKECKILTLLHRNIGQLTLREELIQEVWTDDGVITGRSLDMFISKLRKKLAADPNLRITNIHAKGYRLEMIDDFRL